MPSSRQDTAVLLITLGLHSIGPPCSQSWIGEGLCPLNHRLPVDSERAVILSCVTTSEPTRLQSAASVPRPHHTDDPNQSQGLQIKRGVAKCCKEDGRGHRWKEMRKVDEGNRNVSQTSVNLSNRRPAPSQGRERTVTNLQYDYTFPHCAGRGKGGGFCMITKRCRDEHLRVRTNGRKNAESLWDSEAQGKEGVLED